MKKSFLLPALALVGAALRPLTPRIRSGSSMSGPPRTPATTPPWITDANT